MTPDMTPILMGFIGMVVTMLAVGVSLAALIVTLSIRSEKRTEARIDRLEAELKREIAQLRAETNQRFERQEDQTKERFERLEDQTKEQFERQEDQTNQRFGEVKEQFAALDERIRGLEKGQAQLAAELSLLKDLFTHLLPGNNPS